MKRATDNREENRNVIDKAIDKAMKMKADAMKKIEDILDTFIADKIIFYLLEDSLDVTVYGVDLDGDGVVLAVFLGDKEIADFKGYQSPVAGECDILLAPNIHAGNIMGKMMSVLCNSRLGGFLVGTTHPVIFSSRGSSSDEKFVSICLAAISALNMQ